MAQWEFLIQKEGDRLWLPLESPSVEVLEGRYRMMVRSDRTDARVEIRICHESTLEDPPRRRLQKRSRRLNKDGLMVVIPFTYFKPGNWEIRCAGDLMSDLLGDAWQERVTLHVLPKEADLLDAEPLLDDAPQADNLADEFAELGVGKAQGQEQGAIAAASVVSTASQNAANKNAANTNFANTAESAPELLETPTALQLTLDRETYIAHTGQAFSFSGTIQLPNGQTDDAAAQLAGVIALERLQIDLLDPQTSETVADFQYSLDPSLLPQPFSHAITLPERCQSRLLLGEVSLLGIAAAGGSTEVLATQSFSITANLEDLLSAIADDFAEDETFNALSAVSVVEEEEETTQSLNLNFLNLVEEAADEGRMAEWQLSNQTPLPPQIYQPDPAKSPAEGRRSLQLPQFLPLHKLKDNAAAIAEMPEATAANIPEATEVDHLTTAKAEVNELHEDATDLAADLTAAIEREMAAAAEAATLADGLALATETDAEAAEAEATEAEATEAEATEAGATEAGASDIGVEENDRAEPPFANLPGLGEDADANEDGAESFAVASELAAVATPETDLEPKSIRDLVLDPFDDWVVEQANQLEDPVPNSSIAKNEPLSATDKAFHALRLQDRFWARLSAIATDEELSGWLQTQFPPESDDFPATTQEEGSVPSTAVGDVAWQPSPESSEAAESFTDEADVPKDNALVVAPTTSATAISPADELAEIYTAAGFDANLAAQEIVLDEDPIDLEYARSANAHQSQAPGLDVSPLENQARSQNPQSFAQSLSSLEIDEDPVPTPELSIPPGELTAGKTILVRAKLPDAFKNRCYVKLWLHDCQTRSLIEGPLWLLDFSPDGLGNQEAMIRLTVPFGCLDIQFEAVAVEMRTQQESHKIIVSRATVPPDLPAALPDLAWQDF